MTKLILHCGGHPATLTDLRNVPKPPRTSSYRPVGHYDVVRKVREMAEDILHPLRLKDQNYGLAKDGQHMFGVMTFVDGSTKLGLSIGIANSYDKTLRVKIAAGAKVFVCDNLCFGGDITYTRKHTKKVWEDIETAVADRILLSEQIFQNIISDAEQMKQRKIDNNEAYRMLGLLFGHRVINTPQLSSSRKAWENPPHRDFRPRNLWSLYNCVTGALKTTQPKQIMEKHIALHDLVSSV